MPSMIFNSDTGRPSQHLEWWTRAAVVQTTDRSYYEMEVLLKTIEAGGEVDQLNLPALKGSELFFADWLC